jgi:hypothetical protein
MHTVVCSVICMADLYVYTIRDLVYNNIKEKGASLFFCLIDGLFHKNKTSLCLKILSVTQVKTSRP